MRAAEARRAGFTPPRRTVSKLVLAAWEACSEAWMADSLYDTAKRIGASDTVLSEAYVALERAARDLSETGRASPGLAHTVASGAVATHPLPRLPLP